MFIVRSVHPHGVNTVRTRLDEEQQSLDRCRQGFRIAIHIDVDIETNRVEMQPLAVVQSDALVSMRTHVAVEADRFRPIRGNLLQQGLHVHPRCHAPTIRMSARGRNADEFEGLL